MRDDQLVPLGDKGAETPTQRHLAADIMRNRSFNPVERMIDLAEELEAVDEELDTPAFAEKRMKIYTQLMKYYCPQPKSMDINVNQNHSYTVEALSFGNLYEQRAHLLPEDSRYNGPKMLGAIEIQPEDRIND